MNFNQWVILFIKESGIFVSSLIHVRKVKVKAVGISFNELGGLNERNRNRRRKTVKGRENGLNKSMVVRSDLDCSVLK